MMMIPPNVLLRVMMTVKTLVLLMLERTTCVCLILILFVCGGTISFDVDCICGGGNGNNDDKLLDLLNQSGNHMMDINLEFQVMEELFHHGFECPGQQPAMLQVIHQTKIGWAMKDEYKCGCCSKEFGFITSDYTWTKAVAPGISIQSDNPF
jgi:hypothetical protein